MPAYLGGLGDDVVAGHPGLAAVRPQQRGQHPDRGRLSCPVGSEHAENRAAGNLEVDARKRLGMAEGLLEPGYLDYQGRAHHQASSTVYDQLSYTVLYSTMYESQAFEWEPMEHDELWPPFGPAAAFREQAWRGRGRPDERQPGRPGHQPRGRGRSQQARGRADLQA